MSMCKHQNRALTNYIMKRSLSTNDMEFVQNYKANPVIQILKMRCQFYERMCASLMRYRYKCWREHLRPANYIFYGKILVTAVFFILLYKLF